MSPAIRVPAARGPGDRSSIRGWVSTLAQSPASRGGCQRLPLQTFQPRRSASLGVLVAIDGELAMVGANLAVDRSRGIIAGAAYVFQGADASWDSVALLYSEDGISNGFFGGSVALKARQVAVSAPGIDQGSEADVGRVYTFDLGAISCLP